MICDRDCPRCYGPMTLDLGPRADPDDDGNTVIDQMWRCQVCGYEVVVHVDTWSDTEILRRVDAVLAIRTVDDLDKRREVLAKYRLTEGRRLWPSRTKPVEK